MKSVQIFMKICSSVRTLLRKAHTHTHTNNGWSSASLYFAMEYRKRPKNGFVGKKNQEQIIFESAYNIEMEFLCNSIKQEINLTL